MFSSISSRGQFLFHSLTLTHTHTNYSVCTVYVHMVEINHTLNRHTRNTILEGGVPFHTLFVPYVSHHHTQHSPISSPFTSLRFQHTHRHVHSIMYTYDVQ